MGRRPRSDWAKRITNESQDSATNPELVIVSLKRKSPVAASDHVTVRAFAAELGVEPERIRTLIDRQYIRIIKAEPYLEDSIIARPHIASVRWLKRMFAPLRMVPLIPLGYVYVLLRLRNIDEVRHLCLNYDLTIHDDPVFEETLTIADFWTLWRNIHLSKHNRFDRQMMLFMFANNRGKGRSPRMMGYSEALEQEIKRVAAMPEPDRTFRATALYECFRDARKLSNVEWLYDTKMATKKAGVDKIENLFRSLLRKSLGTMAYAKDAQPYAVQPPASSASSRHVSANEP